MPNNDNTESVSDAPIMQKATMTFTQTEYGLKVNISFDPKQPTSEEFEAIRKSDDPLVKGRLAVLECVVAAEEAMKKLAEKNNAATLARIMQSGSPEDIEKLLAHVAEMKRKHPELEYGGECNCAKCVEKRKAPNQEA